MRVKKYIEVTLIMTADEATWLKALMQNPLKENPTEEDEARRKSIWDALEREGIL